MEWDNLKEILDEPYSYSGYLNTTKIRGLYSRIRNGDGKNRMV